MPVLSLSQVFAVLWKLALPVGVLSFTMVGWALRSGALKERSGMRALSAEIKALSKTSKKVDKKTGDDNMPKVKMNPVHSKWMKFGGGFYGIVALYTYGLVEWKEVSSFIASFGGFSEFINNFNISVLINMFIEGLKNFFTAISWPVYWMSEFGAQRMWIWMAIAYATYWLGMTLAQKHVALKTEAGK